MAKSSPRRVTSYINGKEMEAFVTFVFFRILRPAKQPPMFTTRTYSPLPTMISVGDIFCTDSCGPRDLSPSPHTCGVCSLFAFSAKERDVETGLSYFGARYYSSDLSIWLAVDPMSGKYPSLSPYVYCADNPVKLVDPNGEEVEYGSFADRIIVGLARIFNSQFRSHFKELKASDETYFFRKNSYGENDFTTDGQKLYISYSLTQELKYNGETIFSLMRHETTHAVQFEYGELGFRFRDDSNPILTETLKKIGFDESNICIGKWIPINYDLNDEYEAHNNMNMGNFPKTVPGSPKALWKFDESSKENNMRAIMNAYPHLSSEKLINHVEERVCDKYTFARPYKPR